MRDRRIDTAFVGAVAFLAAFPAHAGEIGHFNGGVMNMRDYLQPEPGFYSALYTYYYTTDQLHDSRGDEVTSVSIDPLGRGGGITVDVDVNVEMYVFAPTLLWVTDIERLGIRYGALISPTFADASMDALLSTAFARGGAVDAGGYGPGDLFVQPVWLGKTLDHWDLGLSYGFYSPIGKYDTETVTIPGVGRVETESSDNIGYGFWTHQIQGAVAWYPTDTKGTAAIVALTYEIHGEKQDFDLTPGENLTLDWGVSQFIPLRKDGGLLLELGPAGYDSWQISEDSGSAASATRDQVHAAGGQLGLTYVPWGASVTVHGFYEYEAEDRFEGASLGVNVAKKW
jgi:hypothetical protein